MEKQVKEAYYNEAKEKATLKNELEKIVEMNRKMSEDAERLTNALKGDSKTQGDWGEVQLERILEHVGLTKGIALRNPKYLQKRGGKQRTSRLHNKATRGQAYYFGC